MAKGANLSALGVKPIGGVAGRHQAPQHHLYVGQDPRAGRRLWRRRRASIRSPGSSRSLLPRSRTCSRRSTTTTAPRRSSAQAIGEQDLTRSIIGVIGSIDTYRLPDAKGFTSLLWELMGDTDEARQQRREEVLGATRQGLRGAGRRARCSCAQTARSWCSAPRRRSTAANAERGAFLKVTKVL